MNNLAGKVYRAFERHFYKKVAIARWQFNLFGVIFFSAGSLFGLYVLGNELVLPRIFAATSPWTQTDWSGGVGSSTTNQYASASEIDTTTTAEQFSLTTASGWSADYADWQSRRKITFDNTDENLGVTSEALTNFPVLIKLEADTDIDYTKTLDSGQDLRFTDGDGTVLSYEIEKWDETGSSYVWVKVPQIDINSSTDFIYMYYGNTGASDGQNASGVWDDSFGGVWHLNESLAASSAQDSTSNNKDGVPTNTTVQTGLFGNNSRQFAANNYITITRNTGASVTISMWATNTNSSPSDMLWLLGTGSPGPDLFFYSGKISLNTWNGASNPFCNTPASATDGNFHHYVAVLGTSGTSLYFDGSLCGTATYANPTDTIFRISSGAGYDWDGKIDEVRILDSAVSAGWAVATYHSETDDFTTFESETSKYPSSGTLTSNIYDAGFASDWGNLTYTTAGSGTTTVKVRTSNSATMEGATDWAACSAKTSGADLTGGCVTDQHRYIQYQVTLVPSGASSPVFQDISLAFSASDQLRPHVNASAVTITGITSGSWTNTEPTITWTGGEDNTAVVGYCISLDEQTVDATPSAELNPETASGKLTGLNDGVTNPSTCPYIVAGNTVNLSTVGGLTLTSDKQYWFSIKAVDAAGNVANDSAGVWQDLVSFKYDGTRPANPAYLSLPGDFISTKSATIIWPTAGDDAASDTGGSQIAGLQYKIGSSGTWYGDSHSGTEDITDLLTNDGSYTTTQSYDFANISEGSNLIYLRTWDTAGNISSEAISGALKVNTQSPSAPRNLEVSSSTSTTNSYSFTWDDPSSITGQASKLTFCYTINTVPSATSCNYTLADANSLEADAYATQPGDNILYLAARDEANNINYDAYASVTFTYAGSAPGSARNLDISDISIKATSNWKLAVSWDAPLDSGAGISTYKVYRSTTNTTCSASFASFTYLGSTAGTSYSDTSLTQQDYYYCVKACDSANGCGAASGTGTGYPDGKYTTAPDLSSGPETSGITTKKATIAWSTSRTADSKVSYGTGSGSYNAEEPSNSSQVTSHVINLTNLSPGTTYYYKAKWTDEDGNTGESDEKSFATSPSPVVKDVSVTNISIQSALVNFTVSGADSVKIYYGASTEFGGVSTVSTSASESSYSIPLSGLLDGTKYYFKINGFDAEDDEYEGTTLDFTTLPRPKISLVQIQQVIGTAQTTILVSWKTNTPVSSIITYYPSDAPSQAKDEVNVALKEGEHQMLLKGLLPDTNYSLIVKGIDKAGNQALSDLQTVTTQTDTRPPQVASMKVEGGVLPATNGAGQESTAQLVISWNTDEPATSQVEFGEGTGTTYSQKTQEDINLTVNHLVVISNLTPSKVYHLKSVSRDKAGNGGASIDTVTITPKATRNALDLVMTNLGTVFGFLGE